MAMDPAPDTGTPATPASTPPGTTSMPARFGRDELLAMAGGAAVAIAVILGAAFAEWRLDLMYWLVVLGGLAAIALVYLGADRSLGGYSAGTLLRITAAIVGAYGLIDFGDLLSSVGQWDTIDVVLVIVEAAGAATLAYGAWAVSGGSLTADIVAAGRVMSLDLADRLVYIGAVGVVAGWFILMVIADVFNLTRDAQIVILASVLVLAVRWLARNPEAGRLPASAPWSIAALGAVAVILGLYWFVQVTGDVFDFGDLTTYVPMLIYFAALVALAAGAFLGLGGLQAATGTMGGGASPGGDAGGTSDG